jgi:hypothetical protein
MKIVFSLFIFCLVLFFYLHIQFHLKQSDDLEMYELDNASKDKLEEICDIRQPVLFEFDSQKIIETTNKTYLHSNYHSFDMKIRNSHLQKDEEDLYVPIPLHATIKLLDEDKKSEYFTENNMDFLQETGVIKNIQNNDGFIRPYMVSNYFYDILIGSKETTTPLRYEINYRNYFLITQGSVQIKLLPPKSTRYLYPKYDYDNFEWSSPFNIWNIQPEYKMDFDKIKSLEFTLVKGKTLYIPAYWWYSIRFSKDASITCLKYRTYMNNLAISPYLFMYALQSQNIKIETSKKITLNELNRNDRQLQPTIKKSEENIEKIEENTTKIEDLKNIDFTNKTEN